MTFAAVPPDHIGGNPLCRLAAAFALVIAVTPSRVLNFAMIAICVRMTTLKRGVGKTTIRLAHMKGGISSRSVPNHLTHQRKCDDEKCNIQHSDRERVESDIGSW
jgi:hypothetical protein